MREDPPSMIASLNNNTKSAYSTGSTSCSLSWGTWLHVHGDKLMLFARQQTRSMADAEDVLQEALIKLAKKEAEQSFEGGQAAWLPFLYTSIRRCAIDLSRKESRRAKREEKAENDRIIQQENIENPWFQHSSSEGKTNTHLERAIQQLPEKYATVITLKIWGEQTFAQIGKQLNISQNTAASRYRYGLEALKKHIANTKQLKTHPNQNQ